MSDEYRKIAERIGQHVTTIAASRCALGAVATAQKLRGTKR